MTSSAPASSPPSGTKRPATASASAAEVDAKRARLSGESDADADADDLDGDLDEPGLDEAAMVAAAEEAETEPPPSSSLRSDAGTHVTTPATTPPPKPAAAKLAPTSTRQPPSSLGTVEGKSSNGATRSVTASGGPSGAPPALVDPSDPLRIERETMDPEWFRRLEPEMKKDSFKQLKTFLAQEISSGKTVYPPANLIHSWSRFTPLDKVKVVVVGQDPYHGPNQACGHSFSVRKGVPTPGSLRNIYKELSDEYPGKFKAPKHGCLDGWAEQGVLLLNACLTVRAGQAASHHGKGWEPFTRSVLRLVAEEAARGGGGGGAGGGSMATSKIASMFAAKGAKVMESTTTTTVKKKGAEGGAEGAEDRARTSAEGGGKTNGGESAPRKGVVFLAWGNPAAKSLEEAGITTKSPNVLILRSPHPSPLSASRGFFGNGHFRKANEWLEQRSRHGPGNGIDWAKL